VGPHLVTPSENPTPIPATRSKLETRPQAGRQSPGPPEEKMLKGPGPREPEKPHARIQRPPQRRHPFIVNRTPITFDQLGSPVVRHP
jgi:hypothetical protein